MVLHENGDSVRRTRAQWDSIVEGSSHLLVLKLDPFLIYQKFT